MVNLKIFTMIKKLFINKNKRDNNEYKQIKTEIEIKVAGTSFSNASGEMRQMVLYDIKTKENQMITSSKVELKRSLFKGEKAIGVLIDERMVGFVPKDQIYDIDPLLDNPCEIRYKIVGGGYDKNGSKMYYGARVYIREAC